MLVLFIILSVIFFITTLFLLVVTVWISRDNNNLEQTARSLGLQVGDLKHTIEELEKEKENKSNSKEVEMVKYNIHVREERVEKLECAIALPNDVTEIEALQYVEHNLKNWLWDLMKDRTKVKWYRDLQERKDIYYFSWYVNGYERPFGLRKDDRYDGRI